MVLEALKCPNCNNDGLILNRDSTLTCSLCGSRYTVSRRPKTLSTAIAGRQTHAAQPKQVQKQHQGSRKAEQKQGIIPKILIWLYLNFSSFIGMWVMPRAWGEASLLIGALSGLFVGTLIVILVIRDEPTRQMFAALRRLVSENTWAGTAIRVFLIWTLVFLLRVVEDNTVVISVFGLAIAAFIAGMLYSIAEHRKNRI